MPRPGVLPKQLHLALGRIRGRQNVAFKPVDAAGETTFEDLPAGKYAIRVFFSRQAYSVVRASSEGVEISGHDLTVTRARLSI